MNLNGKTNDLLFFSSLFEPWAICFPAKKGKSRLLVTAAHTGRLLCSCVVKEGGEGGRIHLCSEYLSPKLLLA